jgi:hypothetical protein
MEIKSKLWIDEMREDDAAYVLANALRGEGVDIR